MRILVTVASFPPIADSAASLYSELAEDLQAAGHDVAVVTEHPPDHRPDGSWRRWIPKVTHRGRTDGIDVWRVSRLLWISRIPGGNAIRYLVTWAFFLLACLRAGRPDVVIAYSPPLNLTFAGYLAARLRHVPFVFNLQDIHPKVLVDLGFIKNRMTIRVLEAVERALYRYSSYFIVYSKPNAQYLEGHGIETGRIAIIPNWVDTAAVTPGQKANDFRRRYALASKFVVSYAGTIGKAQHLEAVVDAARDLGSFEDLVVLLVGDGDSRAALESTIAAQNVRNVRFLPFQPKREYVNVLNASDVCLLPLNKDTPAETVPGKLPQLMASGRPIIAAVPAGGYVEAIILAADCGICVPPGDSGGLRTAILALHDDPASAERMGMNGRVYAEREFSRTACTARYLDVITTAARPVR